MTIGGGTAAAASAPAAPWRALSRRLALAVLCGAAAACAAEAPTLDPLPLATDCACAAAGGSCPVTVCDVQIRVEAATCDGELAAVEVLIDGRLEPQVLLPGMAARSCSTVARGATAEIVARADTGWRWLETLTCPAATAGETQGPTLDRVLHCTAGR